MIQKVTEIPTIDVNLVTVKLDDPLVTDEYILDTASSIQVEPEIEETEGVKLVIKGKLKAQKKGMSTLTGNKITLKDNVFSPELVQILQGGVIKYWKDGEHSSEQTEVSEFGISSYAPPVSGSSLDDVKEFTLNAYSAQYNAAGQIVQYEKTMYPNCKGMPVAFNSEDGVFRSPEYVIESAPDNGQPPYKIEYVDKLPTIG